MMSLRGPGFGMLVGLGIASAVAACVVETEPAPKRPLLRDVMAAQARAAASASAAPVPVASVEAAEPMTMIEAPPVPDGFRSCQVDSDCVAVLRNGCCHDGHNEAINKDAVGAYQASFTCPVPKPRCPMHLVLDRREPRCDAATHTCTLVSPPGGP